MINKHIIFAYVTKLCSVDIKFLAIGEKLVTACQFFTLNLKDTFLSMSILHLINTLVYTPH